MNKSYNSNFPKSYPNPAGAPSTYKGGNNNGNHQSLEDSHKSCMQAQSEKNNLVIKITKNHEAAIGQLCQQVIFMKK
jgi:hypothetical protein